MLDILLDVSLYFLFAGVVFMCGFAVGYSKGMMNKMKDYDNLLEEQRNFYEKELEKWKTEGDEWKLRD